MRFAERQSSPSLLVCYVYTGTLSPNVARCLVPRSALAALNASFNPLGPSFPEVVCDITTLTELNLDATGIAAVPASLGKLKALESLQLDDCPLAHPYDALYGADPELLLRVFDTSVDALVRALTVHVLGIDGARLQ